MRFRKIKKNKNADVAQMLCNENYSSLLLALRQAFGVVGGDADIPASKSVYVKAALTDCINALLQSDGIRGNKEVIKLFLSV